MNKRSLLNFAMCSLLLGSLPVGLVGCKDYDDDITEINGQTSDLSKQLESLNSALQSAQNAANAAAADAKAAADKADVATQEVALAKKAAEEAKAAAIEAAIAEVEKLQGSMDSMNAETAKQLAALSGKIDGIESGLSNIDLTKVNETIGKLGDAVADINKQLSAVNTQITALENFKKEIGDVAALKAKLAAISTIQTDLADVKKKAEANVTAIAANTASINEAKGEYKTLNDRLNAISSNISTEVGNSVNTIAGILAQRLTSVTLIPELYVGGIPTISFESAKYKNSKGADVIITNNSATAKYRLNPSTISESDIDIVGMNYVTAIAQTRANSVVTVSSAVVKDGELVVKLGKGNTGSLNLSDGKIYTASLQVPIADKHLFEGETEASVYSEFTRLEETYFTPELRFVKDAALVSADNNDHLWKTFASLSATAANVDVVKNIVYDQTFDLNDLVEGCKFYSATNHQYISVEDLAEYGLSIKYSVPSTAYTPTEDKTDQQKFVKLSGDNNATLTPVASDGTTTANKVIIGKQPIIEATLYDEVNKNVVSTGYFKVRFVAEDMVPVTKTISLTSTGNPCSGASVAVDWKMFAEQVLQTMGANGMSKNDFTTIYGDNYTVAPANTDNGDLVANVVESNKDASIPVMNWTVTNDQLGNLVIGNNKAEFKKVVTFKDKDGLYPDVILTLNWVVNTTVNKASLGTEDPIKWNNNTMKVTVVPMAIPYNGVQAHYNTNILEGRNKNYILGEDLASCAGYNIALAPKAEQAANVQAYYGNELTGLTAWSNLETINALGAVNYTITNDALGQALVADTHTVKVNWYSDLNGLAANRTVIGSVNLEIVKILNLATTAANSITDNSHAVSINLIDNLKITDAYGNVVARGESTAANNYAGDYWKFYGVETPTFDSSKIFLATDPNATTGSSLASLNMQASVSGDGTLTFQNNGSAIASDAYLIVPVSVKHLWGTLTQNVAVPLKKKL